MKIVELISKLTSASMIEIRSPYGLLKEKKGNICYPMDHGSKDTFRKKVTFHDIYYE
jgi:hypothetical protein